MHRIAALLLTLSISACSTSNGNGQPPTGDSRLVVSPSFPNHAVLRATSGPVEFHFTNIPSDFTASLWIEDPSGATQSTVEQAFRTVNSALYQTKELATGEYTLVVEVSGASLEKVSLDTFFKKRSPTQWTLNFRLGTEICLTSASACGIAGEDPHVAVNLKFSNTIKTFAASAINSALTLHFDGTVASCQAALPTGDISGNEAFVRCPIPEQTHGKLTARIEPPYFSSPTDTLTLCNGEPIKEFEMNYNLSECTWADLP